jgi:glutathione S-transferase
MYQLYYSAGTCSTAVHVVLNELNAPFELIDTNLREGKNRSDAFLKLNPRGQVPVLVEDGQAICEGAAIITYLLDKHQSALLPNISSGIQRAKALQALMWGNASLHPAYSRCFWLSRAASSDAQQALLTEAIAGVQKLWDQADAQLAKTAYLAGDSLTVGDILMTVIANWSSNLPQTITLGDNVKRVIREVISRASYQKALTTEAVEYDAAA